eukprot:SAG25_NODE_5_length_29351_cov_43.404335_23_plen_66_part_00
MCIYVHNDPNSRSHYDLEKNDLDGKLAAAARATAAGYHVGRFPGRVAQELTGAGQGNGECESLLV